MELTRIFDRIGRKIGIDRSSQSGVFSKMRPQLRAARVICWRRGIDRLAHVRRGLCSDVAGLARLSQLVGREVAAELLFTGRIIDADEALRVRLVSRVVSHESLMATALDIADSIAANPPLAVQALKKGLRTALDPDWGELGVFVSTNLARLFATADHREGVAAFLEKRAARYIGG